MFSRKGPVISRIEKGNALIGAITGAYLALIMMGTTFMVLGAPTKTAAAPGDISQDLIYSPCWTEAECLNFNSPTEHGTLQPGLGRCANGRCFCSDRSCYDAHRPESNCPRAGQGKCYSNPPPIPLVVSIGGAAQVVDVGDYIARVYNYGVTIAGIIAGVMFLIGGFQYLTAGGDSGRVSKAKDRIRDSMIGMLLVFGAYVILQTINPDTLRLQMPKVALVKKKLYVACRYFERQMPCGVRFTLVRNTGANDSTPMDQQYHIARQADLDNSQAQTTECIGMSCSLAGHNDATERCKRIPGATAPTSTTNAGSTPTLPPACTTAPAQPYQCSPCLAFGASCTGAGPTSDCCSGYCVGNAVRTSLGGFGALVGSTGYSGTGSSAFNGYCRNGADGLQCGVDAECFSNHCSDYDGSGVGSVCVSGFEGSPCDRDGECEGGRVCVMRDGIHRCVTPRYASPCENNGDCRGGLTCTDSLCGEDTRQECSGTGGCATLLGSLSSNGPMECWTDSSSFINHTNRCKPFLEGSVCITGGQNDCPSNARCQDNAINLLGGFIPVNDGVGLCVIPSAGQGCDSDADCRSFNPRASCRHTNAMHTCTRLGTAGVPCVGANTGDALIMGPSGDPSTTNTCEPGLECPNNVFVCTAPPGCRPGDTAQPPPT